MSNKNISCEDLNDSYTYTQMATQIKSGTTLGGTEVYVSDRVIGLPQFVSVPLCSFLRSCDKVSLYTCNPMFFCFVFLYNLKV